MSRCLSCNNLKNNHFFKTENKPKSGTKIRLLYDILQENKGKFVHFSPVNLGYTSNRINSVKEYLQSTYGLDIRVDSSAKSNKVEECHWLLAGEWEGKVYIDYVAERQER